MFQGVLFQKLSIFFFGKHVASGRVPLFCYTQSHSKQSEVLYKKLLKNCKEQKDYGHISEGTLIRKYYFRQ